MFFCYAMNVNASSLHFRWNAKQNARCIYLNIWIVNSAYWCTDVPVLLVIYGIVIVATKSDKKTVFE